MTALHFPIAVFLPNFMRMKKTLILIAEDDNDDRFLIQSAFKETGDDEILQFVENGVEVMNYLNAESEKGDNAVYPDIIILDLNMPKKSGKEVLAELKGHQLYKNIPVIIYTTTRNEIEIRNCYELGANTYIVKPISFAALREVVWTIKNYWLSTATTPVVH